MIDSLYCGGYGPLKSERGKYQFGSLEIGGMYWGDRSQKRRVRAYLYKLNWSERERKTGKRYRLLADKEGFVVVRVS